MSKQKTEVGTALKKVEEYEKIKNAIMIVGAIYLLGTGYIIWDFSLLELRKSIIESILSEKSVGIPNNVKIDSNHQITNKIMNKRHQRR